MPSFDIVSNVDTQEVDNAVNQAQKEIAQRYDFKGSKSRIEWEKKDVITLVGDDDYKLKALADILDTKLVKRNVPLKALGRAAVEDASGGIKRQVITIQQGIDQDKAREIVKFIKGLKLKVQSQIQGDQLRVTAKKIDDLQEVISSVKEKDFDVHLQFVNMRS
jgi:uncharacterized protein YajQ (UPF0234 family)